MNKYHIQHYHIWLGWQTIYVVNNVYKAIYLLLKEMFEDWWIKKKWGDHAITGYAIVLASSLSEKCKKDME